jgi:DNA-binding NtrC family response regulator
LEGRGRFATIARAYESVEGPDPQWEDVHRVASEIAGAVGAQRLVLATTSEESGLVVAMSVDYAGHGIADAVSFLKGAVSRGLHTRPLIMSRGSQDFPLPTNADALVVIPSSAGQTPDVIYLLYGDRKNLDSAGPFTRADVEFLGTAADRLAHLHSSASELSASRSEVGVHNHHDVGDTTFGLVTRNPAMLRVLADVQHLRGSDVPVLICGESGTGKELIARAIHQGGRSRTGDFVALNAGAISPHLQESELFGHAKGAFTDAHSGRDGLLSAAHRGTLFLDEIGEMSRSLQVKLLRFLQDGEYRRIGENTARRSDARVVSATNRDLVADMRAGTFRRDLLHRLCTVVVTVPPLRERPEDIEPLMEHFLALHCEREGKHIRGFSPALRGLFLRYDWRANNVRELENEVRRAVAICDDGDILGIGAISPGLRERYQGTSPSRPAPTLKEQTEALEKRLILEALEACAWNKKRAAERLGCSRTGLLTKMRKHGIG